MQNNFERLLEEKSLLTCLVITGLYILVATFFGKEVSKIASDFTDILVAGTLVVLSIMISTRFRRAGHHGKAWLLFLGTAISWFIAETTWTIYEFVYNLNPFPSYADGFYLAGYPFLFLFTIYYLKPFKKLITKKLIVCASLVAISVLIPNLYMTVNNNSDENKFTIILGSIYPVGDAIVLVPAIIGIYLFFRGEVNFLWVLLFVGILFEVVGDTGFQYVTLNNSYYSGHPVDILFIWSYLLFLFGIYSHIKIFKKEGKTTKSSRLGNPQAN
ncbi:MAG: hypothetical protein ACREAD_05205 [Nitrosopumilaceae archaeon]